MLEEPDISREFLIARLQHDYRLHVAQLDFLPLGADLNTVVYRVVNEDGTAYFLKLRKGFDAITVTIPLLLKSQGIQEIIVPLETHSKQHWADFGEYKIILYPFIEGKDGFQMELSDHHRRSLGVALRGIHSAQIPSELKRAMPHDTFSPQWREMTKAFQIQAKNSSFGDPASAKLAEFMNSKRGEITHLIKRTEELALELQSKPLELVLCHTDIHGGNLLISRNDKLYIVDWDNPILAPKERDLMFIGGGIDEIWQSEREEAVFYEGYGKTEIDLPALAYYRYERIIQDLAAIGEQSLLTNQGGSADREQAYRWFTGNFEPGSTIELADKTYSLFA